MQKKNYDKINFSNVGDITCNNTKNVGVLLKGNPKKQEGITLIALIITIIVMLILVAVTVNTAVNSGLFGHAKNATTDWKAAERQEGNIGNDNQISDTVNKYTPDHPLAGKRVTQNTKYESDGKTAMIPAKFTV